MSDTANEIQDHGQLKPSMSQCFFLSLLFKLQIVIAETKLNGNEQKKSKTMQI